MTSGMELWRSDRILLVVTALALTSVVGRPAFAGAEGAREQARAHYRQALTHYNLGEFEAALEEFKESYRLRDDPALLFNVGQCEWKLGRLDAAVRSYRAFLRMRPDEENRAEVERRIAELEGRAHEVPRQPAVGAPASARNSPVPAALMPRRDPSGAAASISTDHPETKSGPQADRPSQSKGWVLWVIGGAVLLAGSAAVVLTQPHGTSIPRTDLGTQGVFR